MQFTKTLRVLLPVLLACSAAHGTSIFNFDSDTPGTTTGFTDSSNGISATFTSTGDPGGFVVLPTIYETLTGNVLGDPGPAGSDGLGLSIGFSTDLSAITLDFATSDFSTPSPLTLTAFEGSTEVGSTTLAGGFLPGFTFPEGEIAFSGATFDAVQISSTAMDFAIDNVTVLPVTTPEPGSIALLGCGLCLLGLPWLRRRLASLPLVALCAAGSLASAQNLLPLLPPTVSTVPSNGDGNPYGVAFAPKAMVSGYTLQPGDILVSNYNNSANLQGTGTTIVRIDKTGHPSTFFTSSSPQGGLSAALGVLSNGVVLVGNTPTIDGTPATIQPGRLAVLDGFGNFLGTIGTSATVDGPWGMTIADSWNGTNGTAHVFVSNVLSGAISRFDISYSKTGLSASVIVLATGFNHRLDPAAIVVGPSGLAYDSTHDILYVASSDDNAIYEIAHAASATSTTTASQVFQDLTHLHGPLGLTLLPNGHLLVANSDGSNADPNQPSELVEYSSTGQFLAQMPVDPNNGGAFGIAAYNIGWGTVRLAAVDDNANNLQITTAVVQ